MYLMCGVSSYPPKLKHAPHSGYVIHESAEFVARSAGTHDVLMVLVNESGEVVSPKNELRKSLHACKHLESLPHSCSKHFLTPKLPFM